MGSRNSYKELITQLKQGPVWMTTVLTGAAAGEKRFWPQDGRPASEIQTGKVNQNGESLFVERLSQSPELVICGGGHISLELALMADYLEYSYTVLDDREEFCNRERFPHATACICKPFSEGLAEVAPESANVYYIIVTRGHQADTECLQLILSRPSAYIGMIGSKAKVRRTMELLLSQGYSQTQLDQIYAPIGLDIGGQTPKEIAISIVAQLVQIRNQDRPSAYLESDLIRALEADSGAIITTIIDKKGSAPRGIGSRMLVGPEGIVCGTIGGGAVEFEAVKKAVALLHDSAWNETLAIMDYQVNNNSAASLGMWCGGEVEVMFERL